MGAGASTAQDYSAEKGLADAAYRSSNFVDAILHYTIAIRTLQAAASGGQSQRNLAVLYSNRSAAFEAIGMSDRAFLDALETIECDSRWIKGYFRGAKAALALQQYDYFDMFSRKVLALGDRQSNDSLMLLRERAQHVRRHQTKTNMFWMSSIRRQRGGLIRESADSLRNIEVIDTAAGASHCCAVTATGDVYTWGNGAFGQCGIVFTELEEKYVMQPRLVPALCGIQVVCVACGAGHSVVVDKNGCVYSWGISR